MQFKHLILKGVLNWKDLVEKLGAKANEDWTGPS